MKRINSIFFAAAAAALSLVSCSQENLATVQKPQGELVTVHFGAESDIASTKATLTTEDEATFKSAWEDGDVLSVEYENSNGQKGIANATWQSSSKSFDTNLPSYTGAWEYYAIYPSPDATEGTVDLGSTRTQKGNEYNSQYDLMYGAADAYEAPAGKDDSGKDIIFNMNRQTAIAYFHLTSDLDEYVVSATLSVEGEVAVIATKDAKVSTYSKGYEFKEDEANALKEITITFEEGTAPKATDFQLWFNVLQTFYDKMTLTVETTGHTMSISRTSKEDTYEAGKLYKVSKKIPSDKWVEKTPVVKDNTYSLISSGEDLTDGLYLIGMAMNTDLNTIQYLENGKKQKPFAVAVTEGLSLSQDKTTVTVDPQTVSNIQWLLEHVDGGVSITSYADETLGLGTIVDNDGLTTQSTYAGKPWTISYSSDNSAWIFKYNATSRFLNVYKLSNPRTYSSASTNANGKIFLYRYNGQIAQKYGISCAENIEGGSVEADASKAVEGKEITLSYSVETGYEFKGWDVKDSDGTAVEVSTDGKFTMPAKDVTVSAVFCKVEYTIVKTEATNGSFTVKVNGKEAAVANYGDEVTLEAAPAEGYSFDKWTVADNAKKTVSVSNNKFAMPASNVSVAATFIKSTFASLAELVEAGKPTSAGRTVTVTLNKEIISKLKNSNNGVYIDVKKTDGSAQRIGVHCSGRPYNWTEDGLVSGTLKECTWSLSGSEWRLAPKNYSELTYTPAPVINCGDVNVTAGETQYELKYTIDNSLEGAAVSLGGVDGSVVTSAKLDAATSTVVCELSPNATTSARKGSVTIKYAHVSKTVSITQAANTLTVDQTSKTWASDAADEFVIKVDVNEGASWNVTPTTLDWAEVKVDNEAGTITVTPNGKNESDKANEATLTVTHATATTLTKTITLKRLAAGAAVQKEVKFVAGTDKSSSTSITKEDVQISLTGGTLSRTDNYRLYAGKEMTISVLGGKIVKIETIEVSGNANLTADGFSREGLNGTWVGEAETVKFSASTQSRITQIVVYYEK